MQELKLTKVRGGYKVTGKDALTVAMRTGLGLDKAGAIVLGREHLEVLEKLGYKLTIGAAMIKTVNSDGSKAIKAKGHNGELLTVMESRTVGTKPAKKAAKIEKVAAKPAKTTAKKSVQKTVKAVKVEKVAALEPLASGVDTWGIGHIMTPPTVADGGSYRVWEPVVDGVPAVILEIKEFCDQNKVKSKIIGRYLWIEKLSVAKRPELEDFVIELGRRWPDVERHICNDKSYPDKYGWTMIYVKGHGVRAWYSEENQSHGTLAAIERRYKKAA